MKRQHQPARPEGVEKLEKHHRHHRPGFGQIYGRMTQIPAVSDQFAREPELAPEVMGSLERKPTNPEREASPFCRRRSRLGPHLNIEAQAGGGSGNFLGERRDTPSHGMKFVRDQKNGPRAVSER